MPVSQHETPTLLRLQQLTGGWLNDLLTGFRWVVKNQLIFIIDLNLKFLCQIREDSKRHSARSDIFQTIIAEGLIENPAESSGLRIELNSAEFVFQDNRRVIRWGGVAAHAEVEGK